MDPSHKVHAMEEPETEFRAGLEGVVAAESSISRIDGQEGRLVYAGYEIQDLAANVCFEETCFLLWNLRLPKQAELDALKNQLEESSELPESLIRVLREIAGVAKPMDLLRSGVSLLAHYDEEAADNSEEALRRKAIRLTARLPLLLTHYHRLRSGADIVPREKGMGLAERFLYQLKGERPTPEAVKAMDVALTLHADHGFNASTFAARVTISTLSDIYSAITSAIGTLKGPLHGGANEQVIHMLEEIKDFDRAESWIHERLAAKERIFGFGHRVYKTTDPRATVLKKMSHDLGEALGQAQWYQLSEKIEQVVKSEKGIDPNVDFYSASVYYTLGIPVDLFTPIFAISRISGWTAHVIEQLRNNRLIRPLANYVGPQMRQVIPIEQR